MFGLVIVGTTFQWVMDISFRGLINNVFFIYFRDITVYSKKKSDHIDAGSSSAMSIKLSGG
jgi:hypothetical protein